MKIKKTNEDLKKTFTLVYGPSGIGKTFLASTINNVLIISTEKGLLSLKNKNIDYVDVEGKTSKEKIISLRSIIMDAIKSNYDYIYVDSLTDISQIFLEYNFDLVNNDRSKSLVVYGETAKQIKQFIKTLRDYNKNVVMTALEKIEKDELSRRFISPDVVGQLAQTCPQYFDFVFYYAMIENEKGEKRCLVTSTRRSLLAKDRSGLLNEYEEPNLENIFKKIGV